MIKKILLFFVLCIIGFVGYYIYSDMAAGPRGSAMSYEKAVDRLDRVVNKVPWRENFVQRRAKVELTGAKDLAKSLPPIDRFAKVVQPPVSADDVAVEVFVSTEKSGTGIDGIMVEMAEDFNARNVSVGSGKTGKIIVRKIASGTGYEYIASRKYLPDAFSPSNHLWVRMAEAHGITMTPIRERIVGNVAGVVMKEAVAGQLQSIYGALNVKSIIDAVVQGDLVMGYTNPFASSTGLNFLVTVLATFADGAPDRMLSPEVVSSFESFQRGVPFVALTTLQMRDSVQNEGSLEAFVMEYQTFLNTPTLKSGYEFIPFGVRHDNPLYAVGEPGPEKMAVLERFGAFADSEAYAKVAAKYGFNPEISYESPFGPPPGDVLVQAQKIWKEKKDAGRPISAVFLCDVSGSMRGTRLNQLKRALLDGSRFVAPSNSIGLVLFSDRVSVVLPVKPFDLNHRAAFLAAVEDMDAGGKTAMYDGVAVSLSMLVKEKQAQPEVKPILFVLTDGQTNVGMNFSDMDRIIGGVNIPVYTIGYEANIQELARLSSLVEAASLNAGEEEIEYKIGSLLNAQM
jgi:Ca-activated chloride channel homolog